MGSAGKRKERKPELSGLYGGSSRTSSDFRERTCSRATVTGESSGGGYPMVGEFQVLATRLWCENDALPSALAF